MNIYLDYAATTPIDPRVAEQMAECLRSETDFGNPASDAHSYGRQAKALVDRAREQVAQAIHATAPEIIWTSGATEANNLAIKGLAEFYHYKGKHIITVETEHKAVLDPCRILQARDYDVTYLKTNVQGAIDLAELQAAIRPDTILISTMLVNNETGYIHDVAAIGAIAKQHDVYFHVDAAQAFGKVSLDVEAMKIDLLSLSAHKVYGPKGIGALYVRRTPRVKLSAQMHGGSHELGMRSGTLPTAQILGMGAAFAFAQVEQEQDRGHAEALRSTFLENLKSEFKLNTDLVHSVPNIVNLSFPGLDARELLTQLDAAGVAVSTGAACNSVSIEPSYVLLALGYDRALAASALRISFGRFTRLADIEKAAAIITTTVQTMQGEEL